MTPQDENYQRRLLRKLDTLTTKSEKIAYLNDQFIKATSSREPIVLGMIEAVKNYN